MVDEEAKQKMETARCQLLIDWGPFGSLITYLEPEENPDYPELMGTDGESIHYNPQKVKETPLDELVGSCAHEVLHCSLGHLWRQEDREKRRWNYATDLVINLIVKRRFSLPDWALFDREYSEMSSEEVYADLPDTPENSQKCPKCGSNNLRGRPVEKLGPNKYKVKVTCPDCGYEEEMTGRIDDSEDGEEGDGEGIPIPMDWRTLDGHDKWGESEGDQNGEEEESEGASAPSEEGMDPKELEEEWKRRTATAAEIAKAQGDLPAGMERLVENLIYPSIDWREQLQRFVISLESGQVDWTRPDPRYRSAGVYFPTSESKQLDIALAVDTSGSVNQEQLRDFLSEVKGALEAFPFFKARLLACDADVHAEVEAESLHGFEDFAADVSGGGGTDFRPVFDRLEGESIRALVYLTDGRGSFPDNEPPYDVLWVINNKDVDAPFGDVVRLLDS